MKDRKVYLDILRILAISLVVFHHTPIFWFDYELVFGETVHSHSTFSSTSFLFSEICEMGVPIFFMISGALLLRKDESLRTLFKDRILRFSVFVLVFCVIQNGYSALVLDKTVSLYDFLFSLLFCRYPHAWTSWFLYVYLAILLMLPFMRSLVKVLTAKHFYYLIALQLIICVIIPTITYALVPADSPRTLALISYLPFKFNLNGLPFNEMSWFYYILLGYFAEHIIDTNKISAKLWGSLIIAAWLCLLTGVAMLHLQQVRVGTMPRITPFLTCYLSIPLIVLYIGTKHIFTKVHLPSKLAACISAFGAATIVVFTIENLLRFHLSSTCGRIADAITSETGPAFIIANILLVVLVVLTGCFIGIAALKIPGLRWVLGVKTQQRKSVSTPSEESNRPGAE